MDRVEISVVEHGEAELPNDIVTKNGELDLYEDVQAKFDISYSRKAKRFVIRGGGWLGYVPLNQKYALRIGSRVPISNLEKIICRSSDVSVDILRNYAINYDETVDRPPALFDVISDQFLTALDAVWRQGLIKTYVNRSNVSTTPFGRMDIYRTALRTDVSGRLEACSSAFVRTINCAENQILKSALNRLLTGYRSLSGNHNETQRVRRIFDAVNRLGDLELVNEIKFEKRDVDLLVQRLPQHRNVYADALKLAHLVNNDLGIALGEVGSFAKMPVVLVDMAQIFENYTRETLKKFVDGAKIAILDGNIGGKGGAKIDLFDPLRIEGNNSFATPDIVVRVGSKIAAIIDVKYKPAKRMLDRADVNQIVCYGSRYDCDKVMVVHPEAFGDRSAVQEIGSIGSIRVFQAALQLNASNIDAEENEFCSAIKHQIC